MTRHTGHGQPSSLEDRQRQMSEAFRDAMQECDADTAVVALTCRVSKRTVRKWADLSCDTVIPLHHVVALPALLQQALLARIADGIGCALVALPVVDEVEDDILASAKLMRETAEAVAGHTAAFADGHMTASEGALVESECNDVISAALGVRERARLAQQERVIAPIRAVKD